MKFFHTYAAPVLSAVAFLALAGCGAQHTASETKDVHVSGQSNSGKSSITLDFYPINLNGRTVVQMERCVRPNGSFANDCKTFCTDSSALKRTLDSKGISNANSVISSILAPGVKDFGGNDFKALQSALLDMSENGKAFACVDQKPYHPSQDNVVGITKKTDMGRRNSGMEIADSYTLMPNGDFFREVNGLKCQVTNKVQDFKISSHPRDAALAYFIKGADLWVVNTSAEPAEGNCPKTISKVIMSNVAQVGTKYDYWVTSTINTTVVNSARNIYGRFTAWDNTKPVYNSDASIIDVDMNQCFGVKGKAFSSYVAFLLTSSHSVIKLKGDPSDRDFAKEDFGFFFSLESFRAKNNVCALSN